MTGTDYFENEISLTSGDHTAILFKEAERFGAVAAFSLRQGGCSKPPFDSLNFSESVGDSAENVQRNLEIMARRLAIEPAKIAICIQVHGGSAEILHSVPAARPRADAIIAAAPGLFPAVKTADCLPILLLDPVHRISAAVHAGWRGTVLRIAGKVIKIMKDKFGTDPREVIAAVGPTIGTCCYEVDDAVLIPFRASVPHAERFIITAQENRNPGGPRRESLRLDLLEANRSEIISQGVREEKIFATHLCTSCRSDLFFSHRRDGAPTGRHIAIVGFRD